MTDVNVVNEYISYLAEHKNSSKNNLSAYSRDLYLYAEYLEKHGETVINADSEAVNAFKSYLSAQGKSVATVSRCMSSVRSLYKYLMATSAVTQNPSSEIKNDKQEKKFFEVLSEPEIDKLLSAPDTSDFKGIRDKAMLETLYATGMKVTELISLNVSDVNLQFNFVRCHGEDNAKHERMVLLYPTAVRVLEQYIRAARNYFVTDSSENALFVNVNGERMTRQGFWKLLKGYAKNAGITKTITPHTLRHSFAAHLLENGADINDIKNILGHADISSTQIYAQYVKSRISDSYLKYLHRT